MCDFRMLWIAEVSGAMRNAAEVILKPERFSEVSGAKIIWAEVTVFIKMSVERVVPYKY